MRLDINLATQPYEDVRRFWLRWGSGLAFAGIVALALIVSAFSGWLSARRDRQQMADLRNQIAARDKEKENAQALLNQPVNRTIRDRSQYLNDLFQRKAFSWTRVFQDLERVMPPRLHVVSIRPDTTNDNQLAIKLVVAGESRERALELARRMESSQHFQRTRIDQETAQTGQVPGDNVQFDITAVYVPEKETGPKRGAQ